MRTYTEAQIEDYRSGRSEWLARSDQLADLALSYLFNNDNAEKFAREGLVRRINSLEHAILRINDIYPPNCSGPSKQIVRDAELILQAFLMNIFGAIDNLAWIWVLEREIKQPNGKDLPITKIVLDGPPNGHMSRSLTPALKSTIDSSSDWFQALRAYRNGVAHQIPVYIPRLHSVEDSEKAESIRKYIDEAIISKNFKLVTRLMYEMSQLGDYGPYMALNGDVLPMMFHFQMVCDLATVVEIGEIVFKELPVIF